MINQKESKQVRMDFWLPKLLSADLKTKTKTKGLPTKNHKKITEKKKNPKNKSNGKYNTYHGPLSRNGQMVDTDP